jgi:DNA-binding beta-propeller fold protein YncE
MKARIVIAAFLVVVFLLFPFHNSQSFTAELRFAFSVSRLDDGTGLRDPLGLDVSEHTGDILVADTGNGQIRIFNKDGILIKSIGRLVGIRNPVGVAFGQDEELYVTEMNSPRVGHLDAAGNPITPIVLGNSDDDMPLLPGRLCVGNGGSVYITDRAAPRVFIVSGPDNAVKQIVQPFGDNRPQWKVQDVAVDGAGNLYVLSSEGLAVSVFAGDGTYLRSFGQHGAKEEDFSFPTGLAIDPDGNVWIADSFRHELKVFSPDGDFLFRWGRTGLGDGELFYPIDVAFGKRMLYVLEKGASRLQAFIMFSR